MQRRLVLAAAVLILFAPIAAAQISKLAVSYITRGNSYYAKGNMDNAIADYNMAIAFDPKFAAAYYSRGLVVIAKGDIDRAITDLNTAIEINPRYAEAYRGRGDILMTKGQIDRALTDYDRALVLNPRLAEGYCNRGAARHLKCDLDGPSLITTAALRSSRIGRSLTTTGVAPSGRRDTLPKQSQTSTRQSRSIFIMLSPMRIGD